MCALQSLYLSNNKLKGEISSFFQNSSWCNRYIFKSLYLSYNRLTGMLPKSIGLLSELEDLYLAGNSLEGDVTESHLSNFSKLQSLSLSENSLSLKLVPSDPSSPTEANPTPFSNTPSQPLLSTIYLSFTSFNPFNLPLML
ncbi:hypothetical protein GLYMA_17G182166v4 [Glycine max]|nr:hypothetical protein GLYMA_17G182166v4 [Glycine max]KAH1119014.1 hypothetical protein GYH30_047698 [Glycine max]